MKCFWNGQSCEKRTKRLNQSGSSGAVWRKEPLFGRLRWIESFAWHKDIEPAAAGEVSIQLSKNGILQPQAQAIETGALDSVTNLKFETLVQVKENNTCSCCTSPTTIQVINGTEGTYSNINIVVTKIC